MKIEKENNSLGSLNLMTFNARITKSPITSATKKTVTFNIRDLFSSSLHVDNENAKIMFTFVWAEQRRQVCGKVL